MKTKFKKKYFFIKILLSLLDLIIITLIVYYFLKKDYLSLKFIIYILISWVLISYFTKFYSIYRYTHISKFLEIIFFQFIIFFLTYLSYFTLFREGEIIKNQIITFITFVSVITILKTLFFIITKKCNLLYKRNKNVIVFGDNKSAESLIKLFSNEQNLGYNLVGFFSDMKHSSKEYKGTIEYGHDYAVKNDIDEIYCEINAITTTQLKKIRLFANKNKIDVRLIPENKAIYSKDFTLEYYGTMPILRPKKLPFERIETQILKRIFDILFSFISCVFLLSWLLPVLWFFVKLDSKGSFFFKQIRDGIDGKQFNCYKIRSMKKNSFSDKVSATENDDRITKVGAFLRKTSLDELPQFFNVLKGDMSIVGPRPHMNIQTEKYLKEIDNYLLRNSIKPGITGLAQVSGYRGEIKKKSDIENRVRLDVFYIENWSFMLDLKIILQTFLNVVKGDEKAY